MLRREKPFGELFVDTDNGCGQIKTEVQLFGMAVMWTSRIKSLHCELVNEPSVRMSAICTWQELSNNSHWGRHDEFWRRDAYVAKRTILITDSLSSNKQSYTLSGTCYVGRHIINEGKCQCRSWVTPQRMNVRKVASQRFEDIKNTSSQIQSW